MSRRNIKNYNTHREGYFKIQNEPEEGEIVDDYDLIVSSDEELSMRQRIRELEAENEEIEQIAVISRSYVDKISHPHYYLESSRAAQVPTDVSSISSVEFVTPKKRKRRKSREHKRKHCHRQRQHDQYHEYEQHLRYDPQKMPPKTRLKRSHCKRRQKLFAKKHKKNHSDRFMKDNADALPLESPESSESSYLTDTDNKFLELKRKDSFNNEKSITRDTLRLAVARNTNESRHPLKNLCLKDKLQRQELVGKSLSTSPNEQHKFFQRTNFYDKNYDDDEDDDDVQVIENEPDIQIVDENSTDSMEEKELRLIALKSAVLRKHMARKMRNAEAAYSPTDFDDMLSSGLLRQENKLDDIDIVDLEAEDSQTACVIVSPEASPQLMMLDDQDESQQMVDCKPVDMDIANSDSDGATVENWSKDVEPSFPKYSLNSDDFVNNFQYRFFMQKLHELPPPPPGVDDYDNEPPPYHILYNAESQDMDLDNEELTGDQNGMTETVKSAAEDKQPEEEIEDDDDEEEEALRALLLSKFQSPKNQRKIKCKDTSHKAEIVAQSNCRTKPTEIILKEAVKRLKTHSQPELCKDETCMEFRNNSQSSIRYKTKEHSENNFASLNLFKQSKDRFDKYKTHTQAIVTDQIRDDTSLHERTQMEEDLANPDMNVGGDQTISNGLEVNNTIDISDITRRLQKIKENVLNLTHNPSPTHLNNLKHTPQLLDTASVTQLPSESSTVAGSLECNQTSLENVWQSNKPSINSHNVDNITLANNKLNTENSKTVEANFDSTTNQTTFKVTIKNNAALKLKDKHNATAVNDEVTCKENNTNNVTNNLPLKINGNTKSKVTLDNEKIEKVANKTTETNVKNNNVQLVKTATQIVNGTKINPAPLLRTTKIVKPNKVINTSFEMNLRQVSQASEQTLSSQKPSLNEMKEQLASISDNSRLITSIDQVKHMCVVAPFVISVQNSSNESSEEEELSHECDTLYKPLYDYNDNVSPLSLNLESPSLTPLRSNSPTEACSNVNTKQVGLEAFNLKTEIKTSLQAENIKNKTSLNILSVHDDKINKTPLAVRHLPAAAQSEYRRLVHRMKLLENKRKLAKLEENINECNTIKKNCQNLHATMEETCKEKDKVDNMNSVLKNTLVKTVLLRNTNNNKQKQSTSTTVTTIDTQLSNVNVKNSSSSKVHKSSVLRSYEKLYVKFGAGIVINLDKSLKLVEEAKKVKIEKLKLENRLKELKAEMEVLQAKHKEEQQKISRIYPNICTTNDVITSLKQKRSKVFKAALNLGKSLKGENYRLNNDLKESITTKSKKLATEIKIVNLLKAQDIIGIKDVINPIIEKRAENKNEKVESKKENNEINLNLNPNTITTNKAMVCAENKEGEEAEVEEKKENKPESHLKIDVGGNTEFQSLEALNSKTCDNSSDNISQPNKETNLNVAYSPQRSKETLTLSSYISPLEHLRNIDSNVDPNRIVCPYDLMGNCEDVTCKYVHITAKAKT